MKRFSALFLLLVLLSCTCFSYDNFVLHKGDFLSRDISDPNVQQTAFALGYPPPGSMTDPQKTAFALGYPPPGSMTDPQKTAFALGYPANPQQMPNTSGYPPLNSQGTPNTSGYPPLNKNPGVPQPTPLPLGHPVPVVHLCQNDQFNDEPGIFVGTDPKPGQFAKAGSKIRVWVNDEGAPKIAPGEMVDPVTGQITPGDRTATDGRGAGFFLWEPALYITPLTSINESGLSRNDAENGGRPFFPTLIKGDYNPNVNKKGAGLQGPPIDSDYASFETTDGKYHHKGGGLTEKFTAEYIWDVNSLRLPSGYYHVQLVIHDGDNNLGVDCIALGIGGAPASPPQPVSAASPVPLTSKASASPQATSLALGHPIPTVHLCQSNQFNDEPEIFVGTDPKPGQFAKAGSKIRVWVNDEGAPKIAPGEIVDPVTGQVTPGDRTATDGRGAGFFLWEPALYITPLTSINESELSRNDAEKGGKPFFPSVIKGNYNPNVNKKVAGLQGPPIDSDYANFETTDGKYHHKGGGLTERFTAEYIWDVDALKLPSGYYHVQLVIHDGDNNLGIDCIALGIGGAPANPPQPVPAASPVPLTNKAPAKP